MTCGSTSTPSNTQSQRQMSSSSNSNNKTQRPKPFNGGIFCCVCDNPLLVKDRIMNKMTVWCTLCGNQAQTRKHLDPVGTFAAFPDYADVLKAYESERA